MAAWSSVLRTTARKLLTNNGFRTALSKTEQVRCMSEERTMVIQPSRFQWHILKNWLHFYFMLGAIPIGLIITYVNVFIGPATLEEIPEGYIPKEWEYHQHPIKRFFQRYIFPSPQQEYEKYLHHMYTEYQLMKVRKLEKQVEQAMAANKDYRSSNYFREIYGSKYLYQYRDLNTLRPYELKRENQD
ncbi:NADH dehydrogenase [ubiquinone] 1 beta subcomplex subunit 5, mitochondrial [Ooceraea biroi]|uniref:NADH dehydrogenase [ubiquinone] 1 beta subcomplex subunit 5, mitochondrial n=1 Tax=Ooceraea biroi TaxID=2015173 RepID=UPI000F08DAF7|nr:NADH dehydrogenase [ubiquinone] 1 beta subcomplex subunit 5, mitochondrial [Ooceraea biroi]